MVAYTQEDEDNKIAKDKAVNVNEVVIKHCPFCGRVPVPVDGGEGVDNVLKIVKQVYHPRIKGIECPLNILIFKLKAWNQRAL
jgi:hypothetical protein